MTGYLIPQLGGASQTLLTGGKLCMRLGHLVGEIGWRSLSFVQQNLPPKVL